MNYLDAVIQLLQQVRETQAEAIERAAQTIAAAIEAGHLVYAFGPTHAGILAQELFYRAGGLVPVNPILPPGLTTNVSYSVEVTDLVGSNATVVLSITNGVACHRAERRGLAAVARVPSSQ